MKVLEIGITELFRIKSYLYALVTNNLNNRIFGLNFKLTSTCFVVLPPPHVCGKFCAVTGFASLGYVVTEPNSKPQYIIDSKSPLSVQGWFVRLSIFTASVTNLSSVFHDTL